MTPNQILDSHRKYSSAVQLVTEDFPGIAVEVEDDDLPNPRVVIDPVRCPLLEAQQEEFESRHTPFSLISFFF
jgi:hypothetical protein